MLFELGKVALREAPEVHGNRAVGIDFDGRSIDARATRHAIVSAGDVDDFFDIGEKIGGVGLADTAIDGAVLGKGVAQWVADHGVVVFVVAAILSGEPFGDDAVGIGAVEVIGIDDGEWGVDDVPCGANGMGSAPWFDAIGWNREAFGQVVEFLECVVDFDAVGEAGTEAVANEESGPASGAPQ